MPKSSIQDYQVFDLLKIANEELAYCEYIQSYPQSVGRKNFDTTGSITRFYKTVCNLCFSHSLLIIGSLLDDNPKHNKVISFLNWAKFKDKKADVLKTIISMYEKSGLKKVRDQIVAHTDADNRNNNFPSMHRRAMINWVLVQKLRKVLTCLIAEFIDYTKKYSPASYGLPSFANDQAIKEIETVMNLAVPQMTDNDVI